MPDRQRENVKMIEPFINPLPFQLLLRPQIQDFWWDREKQINGMIAESGLY